MNIPSINNPYILLALLISPWKDEEAVHNLAEVVQRTKVDWKRLLYMANLHFCAPLWLVRLKKDGLLTQLPPELQTYLEHLHRANTERQEILRESAAEIVFNLQRIEVPVILLKGAATFCDDLYEDPGARMMGDIDLLIKNHQIEPLKNLLLELGYKEQPDCFGKSSGLFESNAPHHLPRYLKPRTPVAVEIHFQTARGQAGRALPTDLCWKYKEQRSWEGAHPFVLMPTYRLLHNTVHALVPRRLYVNNSIISLSQLAEFAYLVHRYGADIDWREWLARGASHGLKRHFRVYLTMAHELMGMPFPAHMPQVVFPGMHVARISGACSNRADYLAGFETRRKTAMQRIMDIVVRIHISLFRRVNRPVWEWHNMCYKQGLRNIPLRLFCLSIFYYRGFSIKNTLDMKKLFNKFKKLIYLLKKPNSS